MSPETYKALMDPAILVLNAEQKKEVSEWFNKHISPEMMMSVQDPDAEWVWQLERIS